MTRKLKRSEMEIIPHHWESEREVLGGVMMDPTLYAELQGEGITAADFHHPGHAILWDLFGKMPHPGLTDVLAVLSQNEALATSIGGFPYVVAMPNAVMYIDHILQRARRLRTLRVRRELHMAAGEIRAWATDPLLDAEELLAKASERVTTAGGAVPRSSWIDAEGAAAELFLDLQNRNQHDAHKEGIHFRWPALTRMTGPAKKGKLWVIAARPGMGKSAIANTLCLQTVQQGMAAGFISLEMPVKQCAERTIVQISRVFANKLRDGTVNEEDWARISEAVEEMGTLPLWYRFSPGATLAAIRGEVLKLRGMAHRKGVKLGLVVVDYLQLMGGRGPKQDQNDFIGQLTKALKQLACEADCTIALLSQLNRALENRPDKTPMMSDLRDSGSIEQDADVIMFINRPSRWKHDDRPGEADIIIAKSRDGSEGQFAVAWDGPLLTFGNEVESGPAVSQGTSSRPYGGYQ